MKDGIQIGCVAARKGLVAGAKHESPSVLAAGGQPSWPASCSPLEGETEWNPKGLRCWKPAPIPSSASDSVGSLPAPPQPSAASGAGSWSQHLRCPCSYFASCLFFNSCFLPWDILLGQSFFQVSGLRDPISLPEGHAHALHACPISINSVSTPDACPDELRQRLPGNLSAVATKNQSFSDDIF